MFQTGRLFIQQIFSSYFSIPLLLYCFPITARHRSFLLSAAKRGTLARFPLSRPRLVSVSLPPSLPPPVICRENWLRNIFNCPSIFNGRRRRKRRRKKFQIDRFFRSSLSSCKISNRRDKNIYTSYIYTLQAYSFVTLSKIDFDKEEDVPTLESRETAERTGLAERRRRSDRRGAVVTRSPCRMIGRNPFYPEDRTKSRCLVYLPAFSLPSPLLLSSTSPLFILEFVATGRKPRRHRREGRARFSFFSSRSAIEESSS